LVVLDLRGAFANPASECELKAGSMLGRQDDLYRMTVHIYSEQNATRQAHN
jgi:hypothetical protein